MKISKSLGSTISAVKRSAAAIKNKAVAVAAAGAAVLGLSVQKAHAVLPTGASDAVTAVSTFATDMETATWPVVTVVTVALIGFGLFKKFTKKAAS